MMPRRLLLSTLGLATVLSPLAARADLDAYVKAADNSFAWKAAGGAETAVGTVTLIDLTSQTWQGIPWKHKVRVYSPKNPAYPDAVLLFINGGSNDSQPKPEDDLVGFTLAQVCGTRVAMLPQVPNQPLWGGKKEDDLIGETFVKFLETKDPTLPLLLPMTKSAVRAMDALQQWGEKEGKPVKRFVVTGASKRGWTTWLTGAVDPRVVAIAPMVIPTLNMRAQTKHQLDVWGKYSEQIDDYTRRGLTEKFDQPEGQVLWKLVDPYTYRDRLTMPKLQINGTNDRYWTHDSVNVYWDDLKGPSYVVYLPNAGHNLAVNRDYAINGVGAFSRLVLSGRPLPPLTWTPERRDDGSLRLSVAAPGAKAVQFWTAATKDRDFRESKWEAAPPVAACAEPGQEPSYTGLLKKPAAGHALILGDITYEVDGVPLHLSTQVYEVGPKVKD